MSQTLFVRPDRNGALFGTVSGPTSDPDHELSWLVDGRHGFPLRVAGGSAAIQIAFGSSAPLTVVAICHHLLDAGLVIPITGDVTGSLTIPDYPPNGVPLNAWGIVSGSSPMNDFTLTIAGNSGDVVIGEVVAGDADVLEPSLRLDSAQFGVRRYLNSGQPELSGIPPYSERARSRTLRGSQFYDAEQLQDILDWFDSQDGFPYPVPSLLIPDSDDPTDARLVTLLEPRWTQVVAGADPRFAGSPATTDQPLYLVELEFLEYPRGRW